MSADVESRFVTALAKVANEQIVAGGRAWMLNTQIVEIGRGLGLPENRIDHLAIGRQERGLLRERHSHLDASALAAHYEEQPDRAEFRRRNIIRREVLKAAARAHGDARRVLTYRQGLDQFTERPWLELIVAIRWLEYRDLVELREAFGQNFELWITHHGYDVSHDRGAVSTHAPGYSYRR
jgi:hypothetical protein